MNLNSPQAASEEKCPACSATVEGGRTGCQALWDEIAAQAYSDIRYAAVRDLAFDAYCMQHLETYCRSAKSYAAHLSRLCCGIEYGSDPTIYAAIQKWLNGAVSIEKPPTLPYPGRLTVADVHAARTAEEQVKLAHAWAENVWEAYAVQHDIARLWIKAALKHSSA